MDRTAELEPRTDETTPEAASEDREATVLVPGAEPLDREEIQGVVGAKNVMGTCSG